MNSVKKLSFLAIICVWGLLIPSFAGALPITFTASGTGTGGTAISASAMFDLVTYNFGSGGTNALKITLTNTGGPTDVHGNLLTGIFFSLEGVDSLPTTAAGFDGLAETVKVLIPNGTGPRDDAIGTNYNVDIAPAVNGTATDATYVLSNGPFGTANSGISYAAYNYGIGTVGYGLTGFDGAATDGDTYGIAAAGTNYLGNVKSALPLIDTSAVFWIDVPEGLTNLQLTNAAFAFGSLPDNKLSVPIPEPVSMLLMGAGLMTWGALHRRSGKRRQKRAQ